MPVFVAWHSEKPGPLLRRDQHLPSQFGLRAKRLSIRQHAFDAATNAAQEAISIQEKYGFTSYSGCSEPEGFFLVGLSSVTCVAYDPAGTIWVSVPDPSLLPGDRTATIQKTSWATVANGLVVLCGGMPSGSNST